MIRKLTKHEFKQATALSLEVFTHCGIGDFNDEGLETFKSFIFGDELINELIIYGAFDNERLVGILGIKSQRKHISLFFVLPQYHRRGVGRRLFDFAMQEIPMEEMTVNSSSYAVGFYRSLGFETTCEKQETNGLQYTPMKLTCQKKKQPLHPITTAIADEYETLLQVWESSVRSTHHFLTEADIGFYKSVVPHYFPAVSLSVVRNEEGHIVAFMGTSAELIEMLFVRPDEQGKGWGTQLVHHAIYEKGLRKVDVNEQNTAALAFYRHLGFEVTARDEVDPSGKPYPILHMQLSLNNPNTIIR